MQALVSEIQVKEDGIEHIILGDLAVTTKTGQLPNAALSLTYKGEHYRTSADGDGPVDAVFKAIEELINSQAELKLYLVNAVTGRATDSQGEVTVRLEKGGVSSMDRGPIPIFWWPVPELT